MIGAFFDVDGTLYTANMWRGLMQYAQDHGRARDAKRYYNALVPLFFARKLKLISEETFRKPWVLGMGKMLKGCDPAALNFNSRTNYLSFGTKAAYKSGSHSSNKLDVLNQ